MVELWTIEEILAMVESEGLDYMITGYASAEQIADPELAKLWREAAEAFAAVEGFLAAHTPEVEDEVVAPSSLKGPLKVRHAEILCETMPSLFEGAPLDKYESMKVEAKDGDGNLRFNLSGGRFGDTPQFYISGHFGSDELVGFLRAVAPHVATRIGQSIEFTDTAEHEHHILFTTSGATLDYQTAL
jgi:hypothetical protein